MPSEDYTSTPSTGKLKLKGVKDSRITKKRKNKTSKDEKSSGDTVDDNSVILKKLEEEDLEIRREEKKKKGKSEELRDDDAEDPELGVRVKTEAERKYDEQRRKRLDDRLKREGVKTHKQRVEELNRYLSGLSEHHDMPRIGPG
ncbi:hypothetical protein EPUS_05903 [Endocarpon pusillum Z07020]|uniref:DUF1754-domain-containing protein n=1 Tax=Endocarpon pusillum (strain Z07020 / HMAS-L-300199) TaxID=1263415 RepID=U1GPK2_ENDPU|nr:uncharacterized protein EPUS_05903 [Endocarpon pusillum Z07020]ERF73891.1 hypothetical protein EPUS_05903 [Endocarpon pusillum Z07020]